MDQTYSKSFLVILAILFSLPLFFIPGGALDLEVAKSILTAIGVVVATLVFLWEVWRNGKLSIPWHSFVLVLVLLPLVYLFSALLSTSSALSFFGYNFEIGTFGYILFGFTLLILTSIVFTDASRMLQLMAVFLVSLTVVALFTTIKILSGGFPVWGVFFGNTGNPVGRWTDLATAFGLLSIFSMLILGMIPVKKYLRIVLYVVFGLSTTLLFIVNFSVALVFTLSASVIVWVYFFVVEKHFLTTAPTLPQASAYFIFRPTFLPIVLGVLSLLFLINPTVSSTRGTLNDVVASTFNVANTEVRPSLSATLGVSKAALSQDVLLGSGPNTFGHDWLVHKPVNINATPFWGVAFPFGVGFIPTQIASTGIIGTALWIAFFALLIFLGVKALIKVPESRALRFALITSFVALLYLWAVSFVYAPSLAILTLAFIFSGLFLAVVFQMGIVSSRTISFSRDKITKFISVSIIVVLTLGSLALGFVVVNKTLSAFYFKKAVDLANIPGADLGAIEASLNKAVKFAPADIHHVALSRVYFARAQTAATDTSAPPQENQAIFEKAIAQSVLSARSAVDANSSGYQNWLALGTVYGFLVQKPLSVEGAYENAKYAYFEASKKNPASPEVPLFLAQLEFSRNDAEAARSFIRTAIALKEDYADAYLMLAQLEIQDNNIKAAITSAEKVTLLVPNNPAIYFGLGLLKYSNGDHVGAVDAFTLALTSAPDYANARYYLGLSLIQLQRLDEAKEQFEALILTNPDNEEVRMTLEKLRTDTAQPSSGESD